MPRRGASAPDYERSRAPVAGGSLRQVVRAGRHHGLAHVLADVGELLAVRRDHAQFRGNRLGHGLACRGEKQGRSDREESATQAPGRSIHLKPPLSSRVVLAGRGQVSWLPGPGLTPSQERCGAPSGY